MKAVQFVERLFYCAQLFFHLWSEEQTCENPCCRSSEQLLHCFPTQVGSSFLSVGKIDQAGGNLPKGAARPKRGQARRVDLSVGIPAEK